MLLRRYILKENKLVKSDVIRVEKVRHATKKTNKPKTETKTKNNNNNSAKTPQQLTETHTHTN